MKVPVEWLNSYLTKPLTPKQTAAALEGAGLEVEGSHEDDVLDVTTAANRWDLNGLYWIGREVSAHTDHQLKADLPDPVTPARVTAQGDIPNVEVKDHSLASRYMVAHLKVDNSRKTPEWLARRLTSAGLRSVNIVVDITNYCMLEYAQPLHAFDAEKVELPLHVRLAHKGETLVTLDGVKRSLTSKDVVIADAKAPVGLAGVMGGQNSEVSPQTTEIFLESASFNGSLLRQSALHHRLRTDASARFERRVPSQSPPLALSRAIDLLKTHAGAQILGGVADAVDGQFHATQLTVQPAKLERFLGIPVSHADVSLYLQKLGFGVSGSTQSVMVEVPWWRPDVTAHEDIAEELIKLEGYDKLPATIPVWHPQRVEFDTVWAPRWRAKAVLQSLGLFEVVTYSFISKDQIEDLGRQPAKALKLKNPLTREQAYLRTDLLPSLLKTAAQNRAYSRSFGIYEISKVYQPKAAGELPAEPVSLGVLWRTQQDAFGLVKGVLDRLASVFGVDYEIPKDAVEPLALYPGRHGKIKAGTADLGRIAQLHPKVVAGAKLDGEIGYLEIYWDAFLAAALPPTHKPQKLLPSVTRDLSVVVDRGVPWQEVKAVLTEYDVDFVSDYYGRDVPARDKVITLRLRLTRAEPTFTEAEITTELKKVEKILQQKLGARQRS